MLEWKKENNDIITILINATHIGKSTLTKEFARNDNNGIADRIVSDSFLMKAA